MTRWHNKGAESEFKSFNTIVATVYEYYGEILNFFVICSTNASVESFNAKYNFRASLRGVSDINFLIVRLSKFMPEHRVLLMTRYIPNRKKID
ncbi:MAG: transposase [Tannerella sp.]|nr:transposase [Tannerella sp.]